MTKKYIALFTSFLFLVSCGALKKFINTYEFKGTIYIYDNDKLENGTAVINPSKLNKVTITDNNSFTIFLKKNQKNEIIIKVKNMADYYDVIDTFTISVNVKAKDFVLRPAPKSIDAYKDKLNEIDSLINVTETKLDKIQEIADNSIDPNLKNDLNNYVQQKRTQIENIKQQLSEKNKEFKNIEKLILTGARSVTDISRLESFHKGIDLIEENTIEVYKSISRYRNILKAQGENPIYNGKLIGETFWESNEHTIDDLIINETSEQKIEQLIKDINSLYNSFYMYPDNKKTVYLTIECSADKDIFNTRLNITAAEKYLKAQGVNIIDKDPTSDINNYNLAFMRGYSIMRYIIKKQQCNSCNSEYTLIVYGSSRAKSDAAKKIDKRKHRYAKYTYRLLPKQN